MGTKLDKTSFLSSDADAATKCVEVKELRPWLENTHKRAQNACFESSAFSNIGVSIVVEWITRAALRVHPQVEATRPQKVLRFTMDKQAPAVKGNMKVLLARAGYIDDLEDDEEVIAAAEKSRQLKWNAYLRED